MPGTGRPALLLAAVVVLAGCTAFGTGPTSPTLTATPVWPDELPPGMTTTTVTEPLRLVRAHTAALGDTSFTYRQTETVRTVDGIRLGVVRTERRVGPDGTFVHRMRVEGVVPTAVTHLRAVDVYSNGTVTVIRFRQDGENQTLVSPADEAEMTAGDVVRMGILYSMFSTTDPAVTGPLRRNGTTYLHLRGANGTATIGFTEATNASFEALVAPSGLVYRYAVAYDVNDTYQGWQGRVHRTVVYDDVGTTTVERPGWVSGAIRNATRVPPGG
jgi:hypothetical protein